MGRRVAFDAAKGRLWVVCRHCERWNLAPFDQRWEAIEQAERLYRNTRTRVATDNIGLARLSEGLELVRIGKPLRPEFAAWRYGDQFGRRRRRAIITGAGLIGSTGAIAAMVVGAAPAGAGAVLLLPFFQLVNIGVIAATHGFDNKPYAHPEGGYFHPFGTPKLVQRPDVEEGWGLEIGYTSYSRERPSLLKQLTQKNNEIGRMQIRGLDATQILRRVLPRVNRGGASSSTLRESVAMIEQAGEASNFGRWAAEQRRAWGARQFYGDTGDLAHIPSSARLAFEMAVFEDDERRALEGELKQLQRAWEDAERIAGIADSLVVPRHVEQRLDELKRAEND